MTATNDEQKLPGEMDELQLFTIGGISKSFCAHLVVNDKQLTMEIDMYICRIHPGEYTDNFTDTI